MNKELAFELSNAPGISGFEHNIKKIMKENLLDNVDEILEDNLGSLIAIKKGKNLGPKIMLAAHMDEVGFMISKIDENGFLSFKPVGGWWSQVLLGQRVKIINSKNESFIGIIGSTPPHVLPQEKRNELVKMDDMFIDLGVKNKQEVLDAGIAVGDMIVPDTKALNMLNKDLILGKAWDNRIGCLLLIEIMNKIKNIDLPNEIIAVATVQEEIGLKGAKTSAFKMEPDIAFALDTGIGGDVPNFPKSEMDCKLGDGPLYVVMDAGMIINPKFKLFIEEVAQENNIPINPEIMTGGATDAGNISISKQGVVSTCISIATRYLHSHNSVISVKDVDYAADLVVELLKRLDMAKFNEIIGK